MEAVLAAISGSLVTGIIVLIQSSFLSPATGRAPPRGRQVVTAFMIAGIGLVLAGIIGYFLFRTPEKVELQTKIETLNKENTSLTTERDKSLSERDSALQQVKALQSQQDQARESAEAATRRLQTMRLRLLAARSQFTQSVRRDIDCVLGAPREPNRPISPSVIECAQKIVTDRTAAFAALDKIQEDTQTKLTQIRELYDTQFTEFQNWMSTRHTPEEIVKRVQQLNSDMESKISKIDDTTLGLLNSVGCPMEFASNTP